MFAGPHDHLSEKEIREGEAQATAQVQFFAVACVALWFCIMLLEIVRFAQTGQTRSGKEGQKHKICLIDTTTRAID
ncbi:uncharacterized protein A1O5_01388 [Cladophialophora psammophila CBS 110553]|uniref:Uncharacterized protein n=1 Tax=Cladophialophora psammophila CBS 110553 TaxID=1182543 RepID=W9XWQ4_9EURO|nr:uncharacterized protein A1O5_01388 [Cladophialophora psammophila CBS 110553]EXJ74694.1 hypothetical protein A1O5_01388 [Cladophialophora psammophila CBS 110553]